MTASYFRKGRGHSLRGAAARDLGGRAWSRLPAKLRRGYTSQQAQNLRITSEWHHAGKYANEVPVYYPEQVAMFWEVFDQIDWPPEDLQRLLDRGTVLSFRTDDDTIREHQRLLHTQWNEAINAAETIREQLTEY